MKTTCPNCKKQYNIAEEYIGRRVICKNCGNDFRIQAESEHAAQTQTRPDTECIDINKPAADSATIEVASPGIFWRRVAAIVTDLSILLLMLCITKYGLSLFLIVYPKSGYIWMILKLIILIASMLFPLLFLQFCGKHTPGIMLVNFEICAIDDRKDINSDLYRAIAWIPVYALFCWSISNSWFVAIIAITAIAWYLILLLSLIATNGKLSIVDRICNRKLRSLSTEPLTIKQKSTACVCFILLLLFGYNLASAINKKSAKPSSAGELPLSSLKIATQTVFGTYREIDLIEDDVLNWIGTSFVVAKHENKLWLVTNSHVLALDRLAISDDLTDCTPEIRRYALSVRFASDKTVAVERFADQAGFIDLALLEVDATGLVEGKDYVIVRYDSEIQPHIGDEVVAVGSPINPELAGTHTFGKISAIRNFNRGEPFRMFQIDAAINHGNSGGPLFLKYNDSCKWIGVNKSKVDGSKENQYAENIGFAIDARHVIESRWHWFDATASGAVKAITKLYKRHAKLE